MFVAEKVLLLLVISLTGKDTMNVVSNLSSLQQNVEQSSHCPFNLSTSKQCPRHQRQAISQINSLAPGRSECDSKNVIFILVFTMLQDLTDDKSTLVQVMAWCRQYWLSSLSPYGVARPQWVNADFL